MNAFWLCDEYGIADHPDNIKLTSPQFTEWLAYDKAKHIKPEQTAEEQKANLRAALRGHKHRNA